MDPKFEDLHKDFFQVVLKNEIALWQSQNIKNYPKLKENEYKKQMGRCLRQLIASYDCYDCANSCSSWMKCIIDALNIHFLIFNKTVKNNKIPIFEIEKTKLEDFWNKKVG